MPPKRTLVIKRDAIRKVKSVSDYDADILRETLRSVTDDVMTVSEAAERLDTNYTAVRRMVDKLNSGVTFEELLNTKLGRPAEFLDNSQVSNAESIGREEETPALDDQDSDDGIVIQAIAASTEKNTEKRNDFEKDDIDDVEKDPDYQEPGSSEKRVIIKRRSLGKYSEEYGKEYLRGLFSDALKGRMSATAVGKAIKAPKASTTRWLHRLAAGESFDEMVQPGQIRRCRSLKTMNKLQVLACMDKVRSEVMTLAEAAKQLGTSSNNIKKWMAKLDLGISYDQLMVLSQRPSSGARAALGPRGPTMKTIASLSPSEKEAAIKLKRAVMLNTLKDSAEKMKIRFEDETAQAAASISADVGADVSADVETSHLDAPSDVQLQPSIDMTPVTLNRFGQPTDVIGMMKTMLQKFNQMATTLVNVAEKSLAKPQYVATLAPPVVKPEPKAKIVCMRCQRFNRSITGVEVSPGPEPNRIHAEQYPDVLDDSFGGEDHEHDEEVSIEQTGQTPDRTMDETQTKVKWASHHYGKGFKKKETVNYVVQEYDEVLVHQRTSFTEVEDLWDPLKVRLRFNEINCRGTSHVICMFLENGQQYRFKKYFDDKWKRHTMYICEVCDSKRRQAQKNKIPKAEQPVTSKLKYSFTSKLDLIIMTPHGDQCQPFEKDFDPHWDMTRRDRAKMRFQIRKEMGTLKKYVRKRPDNELRRLKDRERREKQRRGILKVQSRKKRKENIRSLADALIAENIKKVQKARVTQELPAAQIPRRKATKTSKGVSVLYPYGQHRQAHKPFEDYDDAYDNSYNPAHQMSYDMQEYTINHQNQNYSF